MKISFLERHVPLTSIFLAYSRTYVPHKIMVPRQEKRIQYQGGFEDMCMCVSEGVCLLVRSVACFCKYEACVCGFMRVSSL